MSIGIIDVTDSAYAGGAKFDVKIFGFVCSMSVGSNLVNIPGASLTSGDIGKSIAVGKCGDAFGNALIGTISGVNSPTQAVVSAANASGSNQSGVVCNYGTNDTAALNAAFAAVGVGEEVWFPPGISFSSGINATGLIGTIVHGKGGVDNSGVGAIGSVILPIQQGCALFDNSGSVGTKLDNFELGHAWQAVIGESAYIGLPLSSPALAYAGIEMRGVLMTGQWAAGTMYCYGPTTLSFFNCSIDNRRPGSCAIIFCCDNVYGVTSAFGTVATGDQGGGDISFYDGGVATNLLPGVSGGGSDTAPALYMRGIGLVRGFGLKIVGSGTQGIVLGQIAAGRNPALLLHGGDVYADGGPTAPYVFNIDSGCSFVADPGKFSGLGFSTAMKTGGGSLQIVDGPWTGTY